LFRQVIWRRLGPDASAGSKNWRKVHKTLTLVEYLLKHGSPACIDDCAGRVMSFAALTHFRAATPAGVHHTAEDREAEEGCRLVRAKARARAVARSEIRQWRTEPCRFFVLSFRSTGAHHFGAA
jgi:hypothetical protein